MKLRIKGITLSNRLQTLADRDSNQQIDHIEWLQCFKQPQQVNNEFAHHFLSGT